MSLSFVFASFFGALMIGSAYAYFNFKFSEYRFIDFNQITLYSKDDIFVPKEERYVVLFFNSNNKRLLKKIQEVERGVTVLAIDLNQKRFQSNNRVIFLTSSMNMLLQIIQKFNVYGVPTFLTIKKENNAIYKQDSAVKIIEDF